MGGSPVERIPERLGGEMARGEIESAPLGDVLGRLLRRVARRSRDEISRAAETGRSRLELRQLKADRDAFWIRLGKTAFRLVESGDIDHPALRKAMDRIGAMDARIAALEAGREDPGPVPVDGEGEDR